MRISKEYSDLVPPLTKEEYTQLKNSIQENGLWFPVIVNQEGIVLDGHHRYKVCKELGIEPQTIQREFSSELEEKKFIIENCIQRRHLNDFQKAELGIPLQKINEEIAKKQQGKRTDLTSSPNGGKVKPFHSNEETAKQLGISTRSFERSKLIIERAPEKEKQALREGRKKINYVYKTLMVVQKEVSRKPLPEGEFDIILVDPPWDYGNELRGAATHHYKTIDLDQLCKLKIPTTKDCVLFLWVTAPKNKDAFTLLENWGFEYKNQFVWIKDKIGTGFYVRNQHELLFIATKGKPITPLEGNRPSSIINAERTKHSKKPEMVYSLIEKMYPKRNYLELFARQKREGWISWGNEL